MHKRSPQAVVPAQAGTHNPGQAGSSPAMRHILFTAYGSPPARGRHNRMRLRLRTMISGAFAFAHLCALPASAQQLTPLKVGVSDAVNTALPLWMAETGGFYAAQGLKVEIIN